MAVRSDFSGALARRNWRRVAERLWEIGDIVDLL